MVSVRADIVDGSGNLRNVVITLLALLVNVIAKFLVPFRYLTTRFAAVRCYFVGLELYFASMFVIVDISGLVETDNQLREPTND